MAKKPLKPNPKLIRLWNTLSPEQRTRFAFYAGTTVGSLRQQVEVRRGISAELAAGLEASAARMKIGPLDRTELNDTCRDCVFAQAAKALKGHT